MVTAPLVSTVRHFITKKSIFIEMVRHIDVNGIFDIDKYISGLS